MTEWHTLMGMRYFLTIVAAFVLAAVATMPAVARPPMLRAAVPQALPANVSAATPPQPQPQRPWLQR